ncbi:redox-regulatory protein FAM213A [Alligator mississippiensis]|uniref:Peroxiredoxin-like 2A n=1 Tax=Alligator mississippiensis TaxID=8496 RepID=A0A151MT61_ALLMI|nr:redox-regulatory protein FAM213A [Alligator mississippiensis]
MGAEMSSVPDFGLFAMGIWSIGLGALGAAVTGIILANTDLLLSKPEKATVEFLEEIELKTLGPEQETFKADLDDSCAERRLPSFPLSNLSLTSWHYFKGEIFLDEKKKFYGPHKRKMLFMGLIRVGVWQNFLRAWKNGFSGNLEGEGVILGGVYVMGAGKQGVLLEHREKEFGDKVSLPSVLEAAEKIKPQAS